MNHQPAQLSDPKIQMKKRGAARSLCERTRTAGFLFLLFHPYAIVG